MESETRGSRRVFFAFSEPSPVQISMRSPSRPTQMGTHCGEPSGISCSTLPHKDGRYGDPTLRRNRAHLIHDVAGAAPGCENFPMEFYEQLKRFSRRELVDF